MSTLSVPEPTLSGRDNHRGEPKNSRLIFRVAGLYGLSATSVALPLPNGGSIDSGQICLTLDPDASVSGNLGEIDYLQYSLTIKYDAQLVFPGLCELIRLGGHDASLLNPVRVTATDNCKVSEDYSGWRAVGCLEFLPGSLWAGAAGG